MWIVTFCISPNPECSWSSLLMFDFVFSFEILKMRLMTVLTNTLTLFPASKEWIFVCHWWSRKTLQRPQSWTTNFTRSRWLVVLIPHKRSFRNFCLSNFHFTGDSWAFWTAILMRTLKFWPVDIVDFSQPPIFASLSSSDRGSVFYPVLSDLDFSMQPCSGHIQPVVMHLSTSELALF